MVAHAPASFMALKRFDIYPSLWHNAEECDKLVLDLKRGVYLGELGLGGDINQRHSSGHSVSQASPDSNCRRAVFTNLQAPLTDVNLLFGGEGDPLPLLTNFCQTLERAEFTHPNYTNVCTG